MAHRRWMAWALVASIVAGVLGMLAMKSAELRAVRRVENAASAQAHARMAVVVKSSEDARRKLRAELTNTLASCAGRFDPRTMVTAEGRATARARIPVCQAGIARLDARRDEQDRLLLRAIGDACACGDDSRHQRIAREGAQRLAPLRQRLHDNLQAQADTLVALVDFLDTRAGTLAADRRGLVFATDDDLADYNVIARRAQALSAEELRLRDAIDAVSGVELKRLLR